MDTKVEIKSNQINNRRRRRPRKQQARKQPIAPRELPKLAPKQQRKKFKAPNRNIIQMKQSDRGSYLNTVQQSMSCEAFNYLKTLMYPEEFTFRPPDSMNAPSSIYRSVQEFSLTVNLDNTVNSGRFSFACQPKLGGVQSLSEYQTLLVDTSAGWPADLSSPVSYASAVSQNADIRVDKNVPSLTFPGIGNYSAKAQQYAGDNVKYNLSSFPIYNAPNTNYNVPGVNYVIVPDQTLVYAGIDVNAHAPWNHIYDFPCGVYFVSSFVKNNTALSGTGGVGTGVLIYSKSRKEIVGIWVKLAGGNVVSSGYCNDPNTFIVTNSDHPALNTTAPQILSTLDFIVDLPDDYCIGFLTKTDTTLTTNNNVFTHFTISPSMSSNMVNAKNCGNVSKIRPIAMSVLTTMTASTGFSGGEIVSYAAPAGTLNSNYLEINNQNGAYQYWEQLAQNSRGQCTLDGKITKGAFTFYAPAGENDLLLRTPEESNMYDFPSIIVSGVYQNSNASLTGIVTIGRVRIVRVFEFMSNNTLFDTEKVIGSTSSFEQVLNSVQMVQQSMENPLHIKQISSFLKNVGRNVVKYAPYARKVIDVAEGIGSLML